MRKKFYKGNAKICFFFPLAQGAKETKHTPVLRSFHSLRARAGKIRKREPYAKKGVIIKNN
uniref:hypothetical protein n=1 Tax=Candidatus Fimivicinus sp. TaxID=3056640 RepID=UPI003FEF706B